MNQLLRFLAILIVVPGCTGPNGLVEITEIRETPSMPPQSDDLVAAVEPRHSLDHENCPHTATGTKGACCPDKTSSGVPASHTENLDWEVPEGWIRGEERPLRLATWHLGESGKAECYISILAGPAGGVAANINRWRGQMGHPPLAADAVANLPAIEVLGQQAPVLEVSGEFTDMAGARSAGYALLASVASLEQDTLFIKLTGPSDEVLGEKGRFLKFCESLAVSE